MTQPIIFIDDGGVMNDSSLRGSQWRLFLGEFFAPRLGSTAEAWSEANLVVAASLFDLDNWHRRIQAAPNYASFDYTYKLDWLKGMCQLVGVQIPPEEESFELATSATTYIISRVRSAFPGVVAAIRTLYKQGFILHTASGESSSDLAGYLTGMGVHDCFDRLYGPDLIETFKEGPEYYECIFADVGIAPSEAVIVDDNPLAINWAAQTGARTVLVSRVPSPEAKASFHINSLTELPEIMQALK